MKVDFVEDDWAERVFEEHAERIGPALASLWLDNYLTLCWVKSTNPFDYVLWPDDDLVSD